MKKNTKKTTITTIKVNKQNRGQKSLQTLGQGSTTVTAAKENLIQNSISRNQFVIFLKIIAGSRYSHFESISGMHQKLTLNIV